MNYTNGKEWLDALPENPGVERDKMVLDAVGSGLAYCNWMPIDSFQDENHAVFYVCDDAFRVDLEDGSRFRFQASATLTQQCADLLDCSMLTAKICDLAYLQATIVIDAVTESSGPEMVTTTQSKKYNSTLEKLRAGQVGLFRDCGKTWILENSMLPAKDSAVNYGFYSKKQGIINPHGIKMIQTVGHFHNDLHMDYSQTLQLMLQKCLLNNQETDVISIMKDPNLSTLINYDGILKYTRQP